MFLIVIRKTISSLAQEIILFLVECQCISELDNWRYQFKVRYWLCIWCVGITAVATDCAVFLLFYSHFIPGLLV